MQLFEEDHESAYGRLISIKGQYLIFGCGVVNVRKYAGYEVTLS